jgi:hypothetical protein
LGFMPRHGFLTAPTLVLDAARAALGRNKYSHVCLSVVPLSPRRGSLVLKRR